MTGAQMNLYLAGRPGARIILDRIRGESHNESEKGHWFEQLFMRVALQQPEFEIDGIWRWPDWPEREALTGLDGRDIGIDFVARRTLGEWVAIQCKCYEDRHTLGKGEIDKFLGGSQQPVFRLRWIVATCRWGPNAERAIQNAHPQVTQIDFREYLAFASLNSSSKTDSEFSLRLRPSRWSRRRGANGCGRARVNCHALSCAPIRPPGTQRERGHPDIRA